MIEGQGDRIPKAARADAAVLRAPNPAVVVAGGGRRDLAGRVRSLLGRVILRVKTANGTIVLINLPKDAEVMVDGEKAAVSWPGGGKPAAITVTAGKHKVKPRRMDLRSPVAK